MFAIVNKFKFVLIALVAVAALSAPNVAEAQMKVRNVAATVWDGQEDITGRPTKLVFDFQNGGAAVMYDDVTPNPVKGNWRQEGDQVTVTFGNCVYRGRVDGDRLIGTAQMDGGANWNFTVLLAPARK